MPLCFTLSGSPTHTKQRQEEILRSFPFFGIKVCWFSYSGMRFSCYCSAYVLKFDSRYASDLTPDQKDALLDVIRTTPHPQISSEIRRELVNSVVRGVPREPVDQDIVMS
jgi:hypothetical protein